MTESDFTNGDQFANYLSSYWTQLFSEREFLPGVTDGFARQLAQHYQDFAESVNATSIRDIAPFHTELVYPIFLRESTFATGPRLLTFGAGAVFGEQPEGGTFREGAALRFGERADLAPAFYADLPDDVAGTGSLIINRLHNPSVIMVAGADFAFSDGVIVFRENVFENDLIAKRTVSGESGAIDREIVLWATNVQTERFDLYRQYGHLFLDRKEGGAEVRTALESIFKLYSNGPSVARLDSFVAAAAGFPVSAEARETVQSIGRVGTTSVVVTDVGAYRIPAGLTLRDSVKAGAVLTAGSPLTTASVVTDRFASPLWWTSIDGLTVGKELMIQATGPVGFLNQEVPVTFDTPMLVDGDERALCRFSLVGLPAHVETFWKVTKERSLLAGEFLAETLWVGAGLVDEEGDPDYDQELYVNPLRILNDLVGDNLIIVQINGTLTGSLLPVLGLLRETIPAYCTLVVLLNLTAEDDYFLTSESEDAVNPTEAEFVDGRALYTGTTADFDSVTQGHWEDVDESTGEPLTKTAEALSLGISPDMLSDTINLTTGPGQVAESVVARLEPTC